MQKNTLEKAKSLGRDSWGRKELDTTEWLNWTELNKLQNTTVIQVYAPTTNAKEAEVEWFFDDLQDLLEITPKKDVLFMVGDWNAKVGSQEIPGAMGKRGLGIQNEAGQRLIEIC